MTFSKKNLTLGIWGTLLAVWIGIGKNMPENQPYCNHVLVQIGKQIGDLVAGHCIGIDTIHDVTFLPAPKNMHDALIQSETVTTLPDKTITSNSILGKNGYILGVLPDKNNQPIKLQFEWVFVFSKQADKVRWEKSIYLDIREENFYVHPDENGETEISGLSWSGVYTTDGVLVGIMTQIGVEKTQDGRFRVNFITFAWPEILRLIPTNRIQT